VLADPGISKLMKHLLLLQRTLQNEVATTLVEVCNRISRRTFTNFLSPHTMEI
jgi:hypothetical protein